MKILVTGGAGFIGSHLCDALIERKHEIWCVDNLHLGKMENIKHILGQSRFHFQKIDVLDKIGMDKLFREGSFDFVYHLAANSDIQRGGADHSVDLNLTFHSTFEILEQMLKHGVKRVFFASTSAVFGETKDRLHENSGPLRPISFYGASKLAGEAFISVYVNNYGFQASILRFPNVVGPRSTHGALHDFILKLKNNPKQLLVLGDGTQKKPYLFVTDLVKIMLLIAEKGEKPLAVYHASPEELTTVSEIVRIVLEEMKINNCVIKYTGGDRGWVGDVPYFNYDVSKLRSLGWVPERTSNEAIRLAVQHILRSTNQT